MLNNKIDRQNSEAVLTLAENLVASTVGDARQVMKQLILEGVSVLTVDLSNVVMIDSMGIGTLVAAHNSLAKTGGKLLVVNAQPEIFDLFKSMRLDRHFSVSVAAAKGNA